MTSNVSSLKHNILRLVKSPLSLFLLVICSIGFFQTARFGAASLDYYLVKNIIDDWQNTLNNTDKADYARANKAIAEAQTSHPSHPLYRDLQGQLLEWAAIKKFSDPQGALIEAKNYYLNAIKLRPAWPVSYASLTFIKWRLGEFDDEMKFYLEQANKFGPLKSEVHVLYVELGLALYAANHPFYLNLQPQIKQRISYGMRNNQSRERVLASIRSLNQYDTACRWMKSFDPYVHKQMLGCPS